MDKVTLSICIPTFNRVRYLDEAIKSITSQLVGTLLSRVEICISDNASTDGTDELLQEYKNRYDNIVIHKWTRNMGADLNYLKVIEIASGEYCWFLGSDDCLYPGSIERILQEIQSAPDIILFDRADSDITLTREPLHVSWSNIPGNYSFHSLSNRDKFLHYLENCNSFGGLFSYLSVIVFKRDRWSAVENRERFVGSAYVHTHVLLKILYDGGLFNYIKQPFVLCRTGNDSFLTDNSVKGNYLRIKLDVDGYRDIPMAVFGSDSEEYFVIHKLVGRCLPVSGLLKYKFTFFKIGDQAANRKLDRLLRNNNFNLKALFLSVLANYLVLSIVNACFRLLTILRYRKDM